jgi:glycosyltransferase involved in cell wall biosynthesis
MSPDGPVPHHPSSLAGSDKPFWSVMLPAYNSTKYLEKTLRSVLDQDPGPATMQIEVVDGCSTVDLPEALVRRIAGDRISVFRHTEPLSMAANWNSCIERARGEWVHILHTDDFVLPGFYSRLLSALGSRNDVGAAFTRWTTVDEADRILEPAPPLAQTAGILPDWLDVLASSQMVQFAAMVVRKSAYQEVGGFSSELIFALDWEMWVRIAAHHPVWYEPELLACYRVHAESESTRLHRGGESIADDAKAVSIIERYLPPGSRARRALAFRLLSSAKGLLVYRRPAEALKSARWALRLDSSPEVAAAAVRLLGWTLCRTALLGLRKVGLGRQQGVA